MSVFFFSFPTFLLSLLRGRSGNALKLNISKRNDDVMGPHNNLDLMLGPIKVIFGSSGMEMEME